MRIDHKCDVNRNIFISVIFSSVMLISMSDDKNSKCFQKHEGQQKLGWIVGCGIIPWVSAAYRSIVFSYFWCWKLLQELNLKEDTNQNLWLFGNGFEIFWGCLYLPFQLSRTDGSFFFFFKTSSVLFQNACSSLAKTAGLIVERGSRMELQVCVL